MTTTPDQAGQILRMQARRWYDPRSIVGSILLRPRIYLAVAAALVTLIAVPADYSAQVRGAWAWIVGGITYLTVAVRTMSKSPAQIIVKTAARNDDSRLVILAVILIAIAASFASIVGLLNEAKAASLQTKWLYLALAAGTIIVSWAVTQFAFALHYAHDFYRPSHHQRDAKRGLVFPDEDHPDYWDFLYFATSIGATSQTSDVSIRSRTFRRLVTLHAVVSFFFNATVLALMINLAAGLI